MHPYLPQERLLAFCRANHVQVTAYSPLGNPGVYTSKVYDGGGELLDPTKPLLLQHPLVTSFANKHSKTPAQVLLAWLLQRGVVPLPKSVTPTRIVENIQTLSGLVDEEAGGIGGSIPWGLSPSEMVQLSALGQPPLRYTDPQGRVYFGSAEEQWG